MYFITKGDEVEDVTWEGLPALRNEIEAEIEMTHSAFGEEWANDNSNLDSLRNQLEKMSYLARLKENLETRAESLKQ